MMYRHEPLTEREKAYLKRSKGIKPLWSVDSPPKSTKPKTREFLAPSEFKLPKRTRRGFNGCKLSPEKRELVRARAEARRAFFQSLGVVV